MFGSVDSGVPNPVGADGLTFLDSVWTEAPFESHTRFVSTVERVGEEWEGSGALTGNQRSAIVDAARQAEAELQA